MVTSAGNNNIRPAWFVGASFGGVDDQTERFLREGVWEGGPVERWGDVINSIQPGDRIAMKSTYTRKYKVRFNNHGNVRICNGNKSYWSRCGKHEGWSQFAGRLDSH